MENSVVNGTKNRNRVFLYSTRIAKLQEEKELLNIWKESHLFIQNLEELEMENLLCTY